MNRSRRPCQDHRPRMSARWPGLILLLVALAWPVREAAAITNGELLDELERTAFDYFWNEANPANGLIKDRSTSTSPCSIAAVGFGLSAICIGIDRGYVSREDGRARVLTTLQTFWNGPQGSTSTGTIGYQGFFYHFLDMVTGLRVWNSELSSIDTALLMAGVLDVGQYFDGADPDEVMIRDLADSLYQRVDWDWMRDNGVGIRMGWNPESGFNPFGTWVGYNEAMILYILALGSPTHPIPASNWFTWTSGYHWETYYGYSYVNFPPLFGHQYSHCWIDYRSIQDVYMRSQGITYFENSRRATLAAREYCIDNPGGWVGYGPDVWGLTASDGPTGYAARGAPPAQNDDGTITPTAAASSIAFAPVEVINALRFMYDAYGGWLWGPYGFKDAFNLTVAWVATDYLGIDQGPIILMIENYRNQSVWNRFMMNQDVQTGLARATFLDAVGVDGFDPIAMGTVLYQNRPNPFDGGSTVQYRLAAPGPVLLRLYDVRGRLVSTLVDENQGAGDHWVEIDATDLANGVYYYKLQWNGQQVSRRATLLR
jgi:hypothetical protein